MSTSGNAWGSDVPISMPEPLRTDRVAYVDMDAFCFTLRGIAHNLSDADYEAYLPTWAPDGFGIAGEVVP